VFIQMEYIDGLSLDALVGEGVFTPDPLSPGEARALIRQACLGLEAMHQAGVFHRDMKPGNLMLDADGRVKVTDLGLAGSASPNGRRLTRVGEGPGGTPGYIDCQQLFGAAPDPRSDIFALGWTMFDLVCPASAAVWDQARLFRQLPDRSHAVWQALPPGWADVLARATAEDPRDRFQTVGELRKALEQLGPDTALSESLRRFREIRAGEDHLVNIWVGQDLVLRPSEHVSAPASALPTLTKSLTRRQVVASAATLLTAAAGGGLCYLYTRKFSAAPESVQANRGPADSSATASYRGRLDLLIERGDEAGRFPLVRLNEPGALPLGTTDKFRIEGQVDPPAYVYVIWVDPGHDVTPVYPWNPGLGWGSRPVKEVPVGRVSLPPNADRRYTASQAKSGVAAMVLFATRTPLDVSDEVLRKWFEGLPDLPLPPGGEHAVVWFDNYVEVRDPDRPRTFGEVGSSDPFARWQEQLRKVLGDKAEFQTAVSFARASGK
jgi:serine/threonine protein kinase